MVVLGGGGDLAGVPYVDGDNLGGTREAMEHLISLGHKRIGFAAGPEHYLPTQLKNAGRLAALQAAGLDSLDLVAHGHFAVEGGRSALRQLLARDDPPTGVICSSDLMAIGVLLEARQQGLRVPDDLSIVGFDGIDATTWSLPPLTTVEQPIEQIAETAIEALQTLIREPERTLPNFQFRPRLLVRASTAPPR